MFGDWVKEINGRSSCRAVAEYITKHIERTHMHEFFPYMGAKKHKKSGDLLRRVCLNNTIPRIITEPLLNSIYAGVLMSATLEPFEMLKQTLGITRPTFEKTLPLMFPLENRKTIVVTNDIYQRIDKKKEKYTPPDVLISINKNTEESIKYVLNSLENIIKGTDGNVLVFFSSRSEMEKYEKLLQSEVPILCNKSSSDANDNKELFFDIGEIGGKSVLLSYLGGTLTEGIDFKDVRARTVVVVGIGYPNLLEDKVIAVRTAYREEFGAHKEWDYAIGIPTIRKVRQALGRVVRSPKDFGARIMVDRRYDRDSCRTIQRSVYEKFPPKEKEEFVTVKIGNIKKVLEEFYRKKK
jgi:DNA excision repair protein ERCC-2